MKKYIEKNTITTILLISLFSLSSISIAEKHKGPDFEKLARQLELTAQQQSDFIAVMTSNRDKRKAFMQKQREAQKIQMQQYHQQTLTDLSAFMNDDQLAKFEQRVEERKEKYKAMHEQKREERRENKKT
jgi:tRNA G10  N-methylase Trm11